MNFFLDQALVLTSNWIFRSKNFFLDQACDVGVLYRTPVPELGEALFHHVQPKLVKTTRAVVHPLWKSRLWLLLKTSVSYLTWTKILMRELTHAGTF